MFVWSKRLVAALLGLFVLMLGTISSTQLQKAQTVSRNTQPAG